MRCTPNYHKWGPSLKINRNKLRLFLCNHYSLSVHMFSKPKLCSKALIITFRVDKLFKRKVYSSRKICVEYSNLLRCFNHLKPGVCLMNCQIYLSKILLYPHSVFIHYVLPKRHHFLFFPSFIIETESVYCATQN